MGGVNDVQSTVGLFGRETLWFHWWEGGEGLPAGWYGYDPEEECWCVWDDELDESFALQTGVPNELLELLEDDEIEWIEA